MLWFLFGFLTAFFEALKDVFGKQGLKNNDEYVVSWALTFFCAVFLIPFTLLFKIPELGNLFWISLAIGGTLNTITTLLYIKAIKESDLSLTLPMIALTPLFMVITSPLIVGEWPDKFDLVGIVLLVIGSYLLNIKEKSKGYLAPFRALLQTKGPRYMLIVAFLWSITSNFDKVGVQNSAPVFWVLALFLVMSLILLPILLFKTSQPAKKIIKGLPVLLPMGLCCALAVIFQMQALTLTLVVKVIAIKRTSVLMGVLLGYFIFKEKDIQERFLGSATMIVGVLFMTLF